MPVNDTPLCSQHRLTPTIPSPPPPPVPQPTGVLADILLLLVNHPLRAMLHIPTEESTSVRRSLHTQRRHQIQGFLESPKNIGAVSYTLGTPFDVALASLIAQVRRVAANSIAQSDELLGRVEVGACQISRDTS